MSDDKTDLIGFYAGLLAVTEIGLGSILHASRIPLRGQFLSLNQIFLLMHASLEKGSSTYSPMFISTIAAILKSLSPIGNKLTPMLAISMQGLLFNIGILLFGHSLLGRLVGGILSSFWGFIQPVLLYALIFGSSGKQALSIGLKELSPLTKERVLLCLISLVIIKVMLVIAIGIITPKLSPSWFSAYISKMSHFVDSTSKQKVGPFKGAFKQVCKPLFLASVGLTAVFLFWAEKDYVSLIRHLLQPLAVGFLLFFSMRLLPLERIVLMIEKKGSSRLGKALQIALQRIRNF